VASVKKLARFDCGGMDNWCELELPNTDPFNFGIENTVWEESVLTDWDVLD
jgi:hypothetical protein